MLRRLADYFVLYATRAPLDPQGKLRGVIPWVRGAIEVWIHRPAGVAIGQADTYLLKFVGTAGRAERAGPHPAEAWTGRVVETWVVNPPGYGGSTPPQARLGDMAAAARVTFDALTQVAAGRPIFVAGNSIGCTYALHLTANRPVAGVLLRNPPALRQVMACHRRWSNLWLAAVVARAVPAELDSIANAQRSTARALFVSSQADRMVPPALQQQVITHYAGPKQVLELPGAEHDSPVPDDLLSTYAERLSWLLSGAPAP